MFESQQARLGESNRKLRHSCARYQSDLREKEEAIGQLQMRITQLKSQPLLPASALSLAVAPDLRTQLDVHDKDVEIARLRARVSGLQLLLRRGPRHGQVVTSQSPEDLSTLRP